MQMVFARGKDRTNYSSERPIYVNNCGYYLDIDDDITVLRKEGRNDYHLLLSYTGSICVDGRELDSGKAYLFYPSTPQQYKYIKEEGSEYYWLHFSGSEVAQTLQDHGLCEGRIDTGSAKGDVARILKMMIRALSEKYKNADEFCDGMLRSLIALISSPPTISSPFSKAIKLLRDPQNLSTVEDIAQMYGMTANYFIRSFKKYVGMSPNAFRIRSRMESAAEMLLSTEMSVESISHASGYEDPLYFSRAFKRNMGVSPSEYRKQNKPVEESL